MSDNELDYVEVTVGFRCLDSLDKDESMALIHTIEKFMKEQLIPYNKPSLLFNQKMHYKKPIS
jgi:hypothetical protein